MKTDASVIGVLTKSKLWVSIDSQLANRFIRSCWKSLPVLNEFTTMKSEVKFGSSRLDFQFTKDKDKSVCLVEVKTATLVLPEGSGVTKFPDAPTSRGTRHVQELVSAKQSGYQAMIIFVVPRIDSIEVRPNEVTDPLFTKTLVQASKAGVDMIAYRCSFSPSGLQFDAQIPVYPE